VLGTEVETSRTVAGGAWCDWTRKTVDPTGLVVLEQSFVVAGGAPLAYRTVTRAYDGDGQELAAAASDEGTSTTRYDAKGDTTYSWTSSAESTSVSQSTVTESDADGRTTEEAAPANAWSGSQGSVQVTATTSFVLGDEEVTATVPIDQAATTYEYDDAGNQTEVSAPDDGGGSVVSRSLYDLGGRLVGSEDTSGDVVVTNYDLLGRVTSTSLDTSSGPRVTSSTYNTAGWLLTSTDADGVLAKRDYDAAGRVVKETVTRGTAPDQVTRHAFDAAGREVTTTDADGWVTDTTYDGFGRVTGCVQRQAGADPIHDVATAFDEASRVTEVHDAASGLRTTFHYATSPTDTIRSVRTLGDTTLTVETSATGLEIGRYLEVGSGSDVATLAVAVAGRDAAQKPTAWQYAAGARRATRYNFLDDQGRPWFQMLMGYAAYHYDASSGRKSSDTILERTTAYTYTDEGRLASAVSGSDSRAYAYDAAGQITQAGDTALSYEGGVLTASTVGSTVTTYSFDARGRRTGQSSPAQRVTYGWSDGDRLMSYAVDRVPFGSPDVTASFSYDGSGQRTGSAITSAGITTRTDYVYEGLQLARFVSTTGSAATTITYVYDEQGKPQALAITVAGTARAYTQPIWTNDRGDVGFVGESSSQKVAGWTYDSYGSPLASTVQTYGLLPQAVAQKIAAIQPLRYAGYAYDEFSGLYYCSQRYYDPATMQFISRDPALSDAEESAYQYCAGDPIGGTDPTGLRVDGGGGGVVTKYKESWAWFDGTHFEVLRTYKYSSGAMREMSIGRWSATTGNPRYGWAHIQHGAWNGGPIPPGTWGMTKRGM
jgi:RHS repeat-associated protein